jgi:putative flippase GtrA
MAHLARQFLTFAGVGVIGTAVHYLILVLAVQGCEFPVVGASAAGFVGGAATNYWLNYHVTFNSARRHRDAFWRFMSVALVGLTLNTAIMFAFAETLGAHYLISQVLATGIVLIWNFVANRLWTFREGANAER